MRYIYDTSLIFDRQTFGASEQSIGGGCYFGIEKNFLGVPQGSSLGPHDVPQWEEKIIDFWFSKLVYHLGKKI